MQVPGTPDAVDISGCAMDKFAPLVVPLPSLVASRAARSLIWKSLVQFGVRMGEPQLLTAEDELVDPKAEFGRETE